MTFSGFSHAFEEEPVSFRHTREISITNTLDKRRLAQPVMIPLTKLRESVPGFNERCFRLKHKPCTFEPLDIPSQIHDIPGRTGRGAELVFQVDLGPEETVTIELQYNEEGDDLPDYPARTQSFDTWYKDGSNCAWENETCGYRYYYGKIDWFGKSYPHLNLHELAPDSYHSERYWGENPFDVHKTSGLGGIGLIEGDRLTKCYGWPDEADYTHIYRAHGGGPVCAGVTITTEDTRSGEFLAEASATLFNNRYENHYVATCGCSDAYVAPGIRKFADEHVTIDEDAGYLLAWGMPVEKYGTTGIACVWDPREYDGMYDTEDVRFPMLKPDVNGLVSYLTLGVWYRPSAKQPDNLEPFLNYVRGLSIEFGSPVNVKIL